MKPRVLLAQPLDAEAEARLAVGAEVVRPPDTTESTLIAAIGDCDALIARTNLPITAALIAAGRRLRVIGVAGVGIDNVDTAAAAERGIRVLHTPGASSDAVAELSVLLMLQMLRSTPALAEAYRAGDFHGARATAHGRELRGLTVGVLGMGRIGRRVGRIVAAGFGGRVLYNDIVDVGLLDFPASPVDKSTLWSESDILTLHVPLTPQTRNLIDAAVFAQMKPGAALVNTARGAVVDTAALLGALNAPAESGLAGAALDVTDPEPLPLHHPLLHHPRCIVTPHIAARTASGLRRMFGIVDDVLACLGCGRLTAG